MMRLARSILSKYGRRPKSRCLAHDGDGQRQLLVDVSNFVRSDAKTGIQRVVRGLLKELVIQCPNGFVVRPIFATRRRRYHYVPHGTEVDRVVAGHWMNALAGLPVEVGTNDVYLGLDLAANIIPSRTSQLKKWRREGMRLHFVVYDLLPLSHPHWFEAKTVRNFRRWFAALPQLADTLICISNAVSHEVRRRLEKIDITVKPQITHIPIGSDVQGSVPSSGLQADAADLFEWMSRHRVSLVVGTIEPRKGHRHLLDAFEHLWREGPQSAYGLLIVGKPGWHTEGLQQRLVEHVELGRRLLWIRQSSDELLSELYRQSAGTICASEGEGYGLPIVEALDHQQKVLARDLPVFREIAGDRASYFSSDQPSALAREIALWLEKPSINNVQPLPTWADSANAVWEILLGPALQRVPNKGDR